MKRFVSLLFLLALSTIAFCGPGPKEVLQLFEKSWNAHDAKTMASLVLNGKLGEDIQKEETWHNFPTIKLLKISARTKRDHSNVKLRLSISLNGTERMQLDDTVEMKKVDGSWLIVPADPSKPLETGVSSLAMMVADPDFFARQKDEAEAAVCVANLRQIGLAFIMFAGDNEGVLKFDPTQEAAREAIKPYMKTPELWSRPGPKPGVFSFNLALAGKKLFSGDVPPLSPDAPQRAPQKITDWPNVVLCYEGADGKLDFAHRGKAAVVFADGRCRLITEEEAKTLVWKV